MRKQGWTLRSRRADMPCRLIPPCGGGLVDLVVPTEAREELRAQASFLPTVRLSERSVCDLELLATGAFSPLDRFMGKEDHQRVLDEMRLSNGQRFPLPVTLPVPAGVPLHLDRQIALRNAHDQLLAIITVEEAYGWNSSEVGLKVCGTLDPRHPLVGEMQQWGRTNISGCLQVVELPHHHDFQSLRLSPAQTRRRLEALGIPNVIAVEPRHVLLQVEEIKRVANELEAALLLHQAAGLGHVSDFEHYARIRAYSALVERYFDPHRALLAILPLAEGIAGPRELLWHAFIHRNFGANFLLVATSHAGRGSKEGTTLPDSWEQCSLLQCLARELGVETILLEKPSSRPREDHRRQSLRRPTQSFAMPCANITASDSKDADSRDSMGTRPEIAEVLAQFYPPRHREGVCIWFTGPSGAGKSVTTEVLKVLLLEHGRRATVLDVVPWLEKRAFERTSVGKLYRKAYVAAEIVRHGGVIICVTVSARRAVRDRIRKLVGEDHFIEVFVDTPQEVCLARKASRKYRWSLMKRIKFFISLRRLLTYFPFLSTSSYEPPLHPEVTLHTMSHSPEENARIVFDYIARRGFVQLYNRRGQEEDIQLPVNSLPE